MLLTVKKFNIRFIDSSCFLAAPLAKLPEMFGLEEEISKGMFPHAFNRPENYDYDGEMPDSAMYEPDRMSEQRRTEFFEW